VLFRSLAQLKQLNAYLSLLIDPAKDPNLDARVLLKCACDSLRIAMRLHHQVPALAAAADFIRHHALDEELVEIRAETEGVRRRIIAEVDALAGSLRELHRAATDRTIESGRWGDVRIDDSVGRFVGFGVQLLSGWRLLQIRRKLSA